MRSKIGVLLVAALVAVPSCALHGRSSATALDDDAVPYQLLSPDAPRVIGDPSDATASMCLIDDDRLVEVERPVPANATLRQVVSALATLTETEAARGLRTALASAGDIAHVSVQGGTARVDFAARSAQTLPGRPLMTVAQIVCTLTAQPGVGRVAFTLGDESLEVPTAGGKLTGDAVARDDYRSMIGR